VREDARVEFEEPRILVVKALGGHGAGEG
jgi:hypothetical protein